MTNKKSMPISSILDTIAGMSAPPARSQHATSSDVNVIHQSGSQLDRSFNALTVSSAKNPRNPYLMPKISLHPESSNAAVGPVDDAAQARA